jgi:hypothetical protein
MFAGAAPKVNSIPRDRSSLAVMTTYLRRLEGEADSGWAKVAEATGLRAT